MLAVHPRFQPASKAPLGRVEQDSSAIPRVWDAFSAFIEAEELPDVMETFQRVKSECAKERPGSSFLETAKEASLHHHRCARELWAVIDRRFCLPQYENCPCKDRKILVVGAGPAGLRCAIEASLMGASKVTVVEKRPYLTRHNVVRLWNPVVNDLLSLAAKFFYRGFCAGGIHHIGIWRLQNLLLKIALLLDVSIHIGHSYEGLVSDTINCDGLWTATISPSLCDGPVLFDALIAADGEHSRVLEDLGFPKGVFQAKQAIGITCNFVNNRSRRDSRTKEFEMDAGNLKMRPFFTDLKRDRGIGLENLVYYRDETHYLVMTADRKSLLAKGVLRENHSSTSELLKSENINQCNLESYVREVAESAGIPCEEYQLNHWSKPDVQMFDFTKRATTFDAAHVLTAKTQPNRHPLLVCVVGDAREAPFWPQGTGANKAVLSALDASYACSAFNEEVVQACQSWKVWEDIPDHPSLRRTSFRDIAEQNEADALQSSPLNRFLEQTNVVHDCLRRVHLSKAVADPPRKGFAGLRAVPGLHFHPAKHYSQLQRHPSLRASE